MKILISGVCGFVGSNLAQGLLGNVAGREIIGLDNLSRAGSQLNLEPLRKRGVVVRHADLRCPSDLEGLSSVDWIIDAAANPSVLAGVDGATSSRQLLEHNLYGTINLLELAKRSHAGFTLLSTSRVYSVKALSEIPVIAGENNAFAPDRDVPLPEGVSAHGIAESFPTTAPVSLYGASKLASEAIALEYGEAFDFPVWINRCGVLAGAGPVRPRRAGHLFILDQRLPAPATVEVYRVRRRGPPVPRLSSPARFVAALGEAIREPRFRQTTHRQSRRRPGERDVARAIEPLVRSAIRRASGREPTPLHGHSTFPGW